MKLIGLTGCVILFLFSNAQDISTDSLLKAKIFREVKQAGQFVDRFNMKDTVFPDNGLSPTRFTNILSLTNMRDNRNYSDSLLLGFITAAANWHGTLKTDDSDWVVTVMAVFRQQGKEKKVRITLKYCKSDAGDKWVIAAVDIRAFGILLERSGDFIDPLNNEINFLEMSKAMKNHQQMASYTDSSFRPDYMSVFFYLVQSGTIEFSRLEDITYHSLAVPGWLFRVNYYNRMDLNSGWLISSIFKATDEDKAVYRKALYLQH